MNSGSGNILADSIRALQALYRPLTKRGRGATLWRKYHSGFKFEESEIKRHSGDLESAIFNPESGLIRNLESEIRVMEGL
ncbi:MAG: hypothetical protein A2X28_05955 [Elusimicrobia bacterium GWA2_56_46]|nr:MAG: hypothetical protein A2X28_05955 [Elusimicrobia bacterium GWA2_56_46]OGR54365.1 MAG: hypothetical protein A2X39_06525 [Elusimicrobia bacterium GWC2_56_31]HBB65739.1 hypothetical protein [Elusimicrobiota bacterium]HBW22782.1 hypothetical protein [Elusimicrobiota bacterium]